MDPDPQPCCSALEVGLSKQYVKTDGYSGAQRSSFCGLVVLILVYLMISPKMDLTSVKSGMFSSNKTLNYTLYVESSTLASKIKSDGQNT